MPLVVPKPLVGGFGCLELALYGIRELAKQHYEPLILLQSEIFSELWSALLWCHGQINTCTALISKHRDHHMAIILSLFTRIISIVNSHTKMP